MKKIILSLVVVIGVIAYPAVTIMSDTYDVKLGVHHFAIPKKYSLEGWKTLNPKMLSGLDDGSRSYMLKIQEDEVAKYVTGYKVGKGVQHEDLEFILNILDSKEIKRYANSERFRDLWEASGSYAERLVEPYSERNWFKVARKGENLYSWAVTRMYPEKGESLPRDVFEFWMAHCFLANISASPTVKFASCKSYVFYNDISIEFTISEQNLDVIDGVRDLLKSKVESWKKQSKGSEID